MKKINPKIYLPLILAAFGISILVIFFYIAFNNIKSGNVLEQLGVNSKNVGSQLIATGYVRSSSEADLHFQIAGKLTYLPFKEGSVVSAGQTIASIDSYALQKQLQLAANTYQTAQNNASQTNESQQAGVLEGQQRYSLDTTNKQGYSSITESNVVYDNVKRIVDNSTLSQNSAQISVDLANYSLTLASLQTPIDGIIVHEDVTTPYVNVTPVASFLVVDPTQYVFRANVSEDDIPFVNIGATAQIVLVGSDKKIEGQVVKIYPDKTTLPSGENVYLVDIQSPSLAAASTKYNQDGVVTITNKYASPVVMVPSWTVVGNQYIWIHRQDKVVLAQVKIGDTINNMTEILSGLSSDDKIITNPRYLVSKKYSLY